jgi:hypothetical protein
MREILDRQDSPYVLAILHEALEHVRDCDLVHFCDDYRPTKAERRELDESYANLYPELAPHFSRRQLVRLLDRLLRASRAADLYVPTDYHWLVLYACLGAYCELHNDDATGTGDTVGPYAIEAIDFDAIVGRFFWDADFLLGPVLLRVEETSPGQLGFGRQAWKIAAGLRPSRTDLRLRRVTPSKTPAWWREPPAKAPASGYVGPYPLREPEADGN